MLSPEQKQELSELFTVPKKTKHRAKQTAYTDNFVFQADVIKLPTLIGDQKFFFSTESTRKCGYRGSKNLSIDAYLVVMMIVHAYAVDM